MDIGIHKYVESFMQNPQYGEIKAIVSAVVAGENRANITLSQNEAKAILLRYFIFRTGAAEIGTLTLTANGITIMSFSTTATATGMNTPLGIVIHSNNCLLVSDSAQLFSVIYQPIAELGCP